MACTIIDKVRMTENTTPTSLLRAVLWILAGINLSKLMGEMMEQTPLIRKVQLRERKLMNRLTLKLENETHRNNAVLGRHQVIRSVPLGVKTNEKRCKHKERWSLSENDGGIL